MSREEGGEAMRLTVPIVVKMDMDEIIERLKKDDFVQVVRCKDCKYGHELIDEHGNTDIYRLCKGKERPEDWFCADGKRRENE